MKTLGLVAAAAIAGHALAPSESAPNVHRVPVGTVAPEVCETDGRVREVYLTGSIYRVTCTDSVIKLVSRETP